MTLVYFLCYSVLFFTVSGATEEQHTGTGTTNIDEDRYFQLLSRVENLEKRDKDQQAEINMLRSELNTEKQRTSSMEAKLSWLTVNCGKCRKTASVKKPVYSEVFQKPNGTIRPKRQVSNNRSDKMAGETTSRFRRQQQTPVIAFFATLANASRHTGVHQCIAFDTVVTNIGGAYNAHFGSFIAPMSGVYVFSTTLQGYSNGDLHCIIVKNGNRVAGLYMRDREAVFGTDSATVVLYLNKGDDVAVQSESADKFINGDHYTMFSGFLLHEDQPRENIVGK